MVTMLLITLHFIIGSENLDAQSEGSGNQVENFNVSSGKLWYKVI